MSTQLSLGKEITHNDRSYLVVGIVDAEYLFETNEKTWERISEKYATLRSADGDIDFITLTQTNSPFNDKHSTIKALPWFPWRKHVDV